MKVGQLIHNVTAYRGGFDDIANDSNLNTIHFHSQRWHNVLISIEFRCFRVVYVTTNHWESCVGQERLKSLNSIIKFVVSRTHGCEVHQFSKMSHNGPFEMCVPNCSLVEITTIEENDIVSLSFYIVHCSFQSGQATIALSFFCK